MNLVLFLQDWLIQTAVQSFSDAKTRSLTIEAFREQRSEYSPPQDAKTQGDKTMLNEKAEKIQGLMKKIA